ncbi:hypothetical protein BATDEDRAFT_19365 [Batrachochytrium dendrobatidis JAM81]|uniref:Nucleolar GTP-binding protein 2 n=2 Tax=Batrachochytrium dendrobatidis TaxID=109871 RepID=F4P0V6_BATDJ|nr:uncharacterized protein BATDEDRAFT_19365 [Batrachochytrium dendrobatidis JAM81]EGF81349.1 hypothetical protein BATDEDRAFT_19365 [Batrachochytrium dendrobatidis JAM81]KAJ8329571.1 GTPase required for pre-60S ribosomal subunit nuclear export and maturation [Batrachochytrium dendrobatidis]KAK5669470.1 GTPase required for pre-60S ribosomal subunit nuclear export and maturation [Batrachochytrium dendrobatidis]OAJ37995.1 hypothetical protein BDEG_21964 [Batrachochytrium dendrobatidis JEL423]|eukprot:XP_006677820.1 hypothetical protein BATDEDRAFT_19365 [Batrachochytrium dendrobatidis JAM81]
MGTFKKERSGAGKSAASAEGGHSLTNVTHVKGVNFYRNAKQVRQLNMIKGGKPTRDASGKITKAAVFQTRLAPGTQARVQSDRRWFENTRVVGQKELDSFRDAINSKLNDPYSFVLRTKQLPLGLVSEYQKQSRMHLLDTETFGSTFGPKAQRKKPKLNAASMEDLATHVDTKIGGYDVDKDEILKVNVDGTIPEARDPIFKKGQSKRIWNELYKVIDSSDVIIHVLDARNPEGTRCPNVERHLKKEARHKQLIFVLNKCDLVPSWVTEKWKRTLEAEYPTVAFHANINNSFGKSALINLLRQFSKLHSDKKQISVGFVGYPNTGKSSIINTLKAKKVCCVAPIPGETKVWQYITLMKRIYLIDCPGVVYGSSEDTETDIVLKGVVRIENISLPEQYIPAIIERVRQEYLARTYSLTSWTDYVDFLSQIATRSGKLLKGGDPDINTVAKMVLNDFIRGKIPYYTLPKKPLAILPEAESTSATAIAESVSTEVELDTPHDIKFKTVSRVEQKMSHIRVLQNYLPDEMEHAGVSKEELEHEAALAAAANDKSSIDDELDYDSGDDDVTEVSTVTAGTKSSQWRDELSDDEVLKDDSTSSSPISKNSAVTSPLKRLVSTTNRAAKSTKVKNAPAAFSDEEVDRRHSKKEPRMTTNKKKVGSNFYDTANVKNRNRNKSRPDASSKSAAKGKWNVE